MIKELNQGNFDIPFFPKIEDCDYWMFSYSYNESLKEQIIEGEITLEHIIKWCSEGDGCAQYGIVLDKDILISWSGRCGVVFGDIEEFCFSEFADSYDTKRIISDNLEELKTYIENMDAYEVLKK